MQARRGDGARDRVAVTHERAHQLVAERFQTELQTGSGRVALDPACHLDGRYSRARRTALRRLAGRNEQFNPRTSAGMKSGAILFCAGILLTACGSSHDDRSALATPQPTAIATPRAPVSAFKALVASHPGQRFTVVTPQNAATEAAKSSTVAAIAPQSGASEAPKPTAFVTPQSGASEATKTGGLVTPQSGASEAAKAAGAEPRAVTSPMMSGVPASGVTSAAGDTLPPGVPYASDTDPVRIVSYILSSTVIHPGDAITGDVVTSSNAASVTARVGSFSVAVPKVAPGKFHFHMQM